MVVQDFYICSSYSEFARSSTERYFVSPPEHRDDKVERDTLSSATNDLRVCGKNQFIKVNSAQDASL